MHTTFASRVAAGVLLIVAGIISIACNTEVGPPLPLVTVQVNNAHDSVTTSGQAPEAIDAATAEPDANQAGLMQLRVQHPAFQIQTAPGLSAPAISVPEQAKPAVVYEALYFTANMLEESSADASDELSKLVEHSSIMVVGTVSNSQADVVRSPHEGVNNNNVGVANVYGFEVDRYLKGSGLDTISVIQFIGVDVTTAQGETIQARDKLDNLLLGRGSRYLLFLTR